jgi:hypothetical protein
MQTWPVQDAKERFSEFLDACLLEGPQMVTRHGTEAAVRVLHEAMTSTAWRDHVQAPQPNGLPQVPRGVFMGYDFHLTESGPKLIEINTNAGGPCSTWRSRGRSTLAAMQPKIGCVPRQM